MVKLINLFLFKFSSEPAEGIKECLYLLVLASGCLKWEPERARFKTLGAVQGVGAVRQDGFFFL